MPSLIIKQITVIIFKCSAAYFTGMFSLITGMDSEYMTVISDGLLIIRFNGIIILRMDSRSSSNQCFHLNVIREHDVQTVYHVSSWDWYHCLSILNVWTHCNHVYWLEWIDCDSMITDDFNRLIRVHAVMQYSQHDFLECIVIISSSGLNFGNGFKLISGFAINVWMPASWEYSHHAFNVLNTDCWMSSWFMLITML